MSCECKEEMMYQEFADIYDNVMSEIPYDTWFEKLYCYLASQGKTNGHLCELGCGTGQMARRFAAAGYEVTGVDLSPDMLAVAETQQRGAEARVLYVNQDMRYFELHKPADVVLCVCDSVNYLRNDEDLLDMFRRVGENMNKDGVFVFDIKTEYCYAHILGDNIRVEDEEPYTLIWENEFDRETGENTYYITLFLKQEDEGYRRFDECHVQKAWPPEQIKELLSRAGLSLCACMGQRMEGEPGEEEERIYFVAKKGGR